MRQLSDLQCHAQRLCNGLQCNSVVALLYTDEGFLIRMSAFVGCNEEISCGNVTDVFLILLRERLLQHQYLLQGTNFFGMIQET